MLTCIVRGTRVSLLIPNGFPSREARILVFEQSMPGDLPLFKAGKRYTYKGGKDETMLHSPKRELLKLARAEAPTSNKVWSMWDSADTSPFRIPLRPSLSPPFAAGFLQLPSGLCGLRHQFGGHSGQYAECDEQAPCEQLLQSKICTNKRRAKF